MAEFHDRHLALQYIKDRGYASHSSLKRYINGEAPDNYFSSDAQTFGKELHSRFLEKKLVIKMSTPLEMLCKAMLLALKLDKMVQRLMLKIKVEQEFKLKILDVMMLGYFDIVGKNYIADLKTTRCTTLNQFVSSLDFMQAAIYLRATGFKDFFYIGITKEMQPKVIIFNVRDYPDRLAKADAELVYWLKQLKADLKNDKTKD